MFCVVASGTPLGDQTFELYKLNHHIVECIFSHCHSFIGALLILPGPHPSFGHVADGLDGYFDACW